MHIHRIQSLHVHPRIICLSRSMAQPTSRSLAYCMSIFYRPIYLYRPLLNDENFIANCRGRKGFYGCLPGRVFISIPGTFRIGSPWLWPPLAPCLPRAFDQPRFPQPPISTPTILDPPYVANACEYTPTTTYCYVSSAHVKQTMIYRFCVASKRLLCRVIEGTRLVGGAS